MKKKYLLLLGVTFLCSCNTPKAKKREVEQRYEPTWKSLQHFKVPEWFRDAKLGYWSIWGIYSVPAFKGKHAAEWYGRWMYCKEGQSSRDNQGLPTHLHHLTKYGDPHTFGYKDFIPMFKGENFNADNWADLAVRGGAKYFTVTAVFHDSFCMWDTKLSKWNSVNMGPHKDIVAAVGKSVRARGLKFGVSNHSAWNPIFFEWNHINKYDAIDSAYKDLYGTPIIQAGADTIRIYQGETRNTWIPRSRGAVIPSKRDIQRWYDRTIELCDKCKPDLYYFDWGFKPKEYEKGRQDFGAHYYNKAIEWGKGIYGNPNVVLNYKGNSYATGSAVLDHEHGGEKTIRKEAWQTDDNIYADNNWSYDPSVPIKKANTIIDELIDIVSKNGNLMLAFAPKADGTFPEDQIQLADSIGGWMKICGQALYATRPWKVSGEECENTSVRYTRSKDKRTVYAIFLTWNEKPLLLKSFADCSVIDSIILIGSKEKVNWKQRVQGLQITLPKEKPNYRYAYPLEIKFK